MIRIKKAQEQLSEVCTTCCENLHFYVWAIFKIATQYTYFQYVWFVHLIVFMIQVKYRMEGLKAKTTSLYDGEAREVVHVKHVTDLVSKVSPRLWCLLTFHFVW